MHAVITGHIVDKSLRTPQEWVQALKSVLNGFGSEPLDWQLFRGDSFQLVIDEPQNALLTALRIRAAFKVAMGQDLQLAIGIGTVDFRSEAVAESNGDAFQRSEYLFDQIVKQRCLLALSTPWPAFDELMDVCLALALVVVDDWSQASAEYLHARWDYPEANQEGLSRILGIGQSSVSDRKRRSHVEELTLLDHFFRTKYEAYLA